MLHEPSQACTGRGASGAAFGRDSEMRIIVVNVNTSQTMTAVIEEAARRYASAGTQITALQPYFGAEGVDCNFESYLSAVAVMDRGVGYPGGYDARGLAALRGRCRDGVTGRLEQPAFRHLRA